MAIGDGVSAIASLTAGFGGFSPTAFDGVEASKKQVERAENILARMHEMNRRKAELERARTSKPHKSKDGHGTVWTYVVIDEQVARITHCDTHASSLVIPSDIDDYPVYGIGPDACAHLDTIEEVICPDSIMSIGSCAFRLCPKLRRVVLPENVPDFSASWLQHCDALEQLVLPGLLETITSAVLDNSGLKSLRIGPCVKTVVPGAFEKTQLETLELDPRNPYLKTDGAALYSQDGRVLIALCRPLSHYNIAEGCVKVAKKAFCNMHSLEGVGLPSTLEVVGKFSFAHSELKEATLPSGVRVVGEKAFFHCRSLDSIELNDGLARIDDSAFEESGLRALRIPATIDRIGSSIVRNSNVTASGENATIVIDPNSRSLFLDGSGGLYRNEDDGIHLIQLIDESATAFKGHPGTRFIDDRAFALHPALETAEFSDGLEEVGQGAFRVCGRLRSVSLPDSVRTIGANAFLDTQLASFTVPAALEYFGENALVTEGAHHFGNPPSIANVEVAPGNKRFFVRCGMLCERGENGDRIIVYAGGVPDVVIPDGITSVAAHAFSNARGVRSMSIPPTVTTIGTVGLGVWSLVEHIHIELSKPLEGRRVFDFHFPATARSIHSISLALGGSSWVNVPDIMVQYDNCIAHAHDYHGHDRDSISAYEQVTRIIARLKDPILLTNVNRTMFNRLVNEHLVEMCVDIARHDDREAMEALLDFGYLNEGNLEEVIAAVGRLQDAAMTGYLLEVKRRRFNKRVFDFDL